MPIENYEDVSNYALDPDQQEELLRSQKEASFIWGTKDHWPVGVIMSYVWRDGSFWLTATTQRKRIAALRRDNRVTVIVSGMGTPVGPSTSATAKGRCFFHDDEDTKAWFYPALSEAVLGGTGPLTDMFTQMLDSERRVILEVVPEKWITFDASKMMADSLEAWTTAAQGGSGPSGVDLP